MVAAIATPSVGLADFEMLLNRLLPSVPAPPPRSVTKGIETVVDTGTGAGVATSVCNHGYRNDAAASAAAGTRRYWTLVVCFSCAKPGRGVSSCPQLGETFPYMLPGWSAEKVDGNI